MSIISKLKILFGESSEDLSTANKNTDSFADNLILEIRRAVNDAVILELEKNQEKYLSSILKNSHFPIESIALIPSDHDTAINTSEFFRIHSDLDINFENNFLINNLPKEFRTGKGAKAILKPGLSFSIQPSRLGIDNPTVDEAYQINLRGNRKKFSAIVDLGKITADQLIGDIKDSFIQQSDNNINSNNSKYSRDEKEVIATNGNSFDVDERHIENQQKKSTRIYLQIRDKQGERKVVATLPVIIGRTSKLEFHDQYQKIDIDATYISRNQFVIIEVNNITYGFIPKEAKLTAVAGRRGTLRPLSLIEIEDSGLRMTFGQPLDSGITVVNPEDPSLYPSVSITLDIAPRNEKITPVPNVRK